MENIDQIREFPEIETERLILRAIMPEDVESIFDIFSKEEIMKYYGMYPIETTEQAEKLIHNLNCCFEKNIGIRWAIVLKKDNKLIGTCGYHNWNKPHSRAEIGYELSDDYWGQGFMKEVLKAVIPFGFDNMDLNRIEALVYPENTSSNMLLKKIGFEKEGLLKEYTYFRDKYQDLIMFSLLKKKWNH